MSFGVAGAMESAMAEAIKEIDRKMDRAFKNAMDRIQPELLKVMEKASVQNYYGGYSPKFYIRTGQLNKAISLELKNTSYGDMFAFNVIPGYDESGMDHSEYDVWVTYTRKGGRNRKGKSGTYRYKAHVKLKKKPDEEEILERALGEGYHPKVGTANTDAPIWTEDDEGVLIDELQDYVGKNFERIFNEEYDKL